MLRDGKPSLIKTTSKCFVYRKNILVPVCTLLKKDVEVDILLNTYICRGTNLEMTIALHLCDS